MGHKFVEFQSKTKNPNLAVVEDVSVDEVREKKAHLKLIDVRRPDEWVGEYGHIPEAELMTLDTLPQRLAELPKDSTVVFVCRSGARSAQATAFAKSHGFVSVYNMLGGMIEWTRKNFETAERNGGQQ